MTTITGQNNAIMKILPQALDDLARLRSVFPGAMLGGSSVYAPREGQDRDFFIPIRDADPDLEAIKAKIGEIFPLDRTQTWSVYREHLGGYENVTTTAAATFAPYGEKDPHFSGQSAFGRSVLKTDGRDFVVIGGIEADSHALATWMKGFQPIIQQAVLTDGEYFYNSKGVNHNEIVIDLSKVHTFRQLQEIQVRAARMAGAAFQFTWNNRHSVHVWEIPDAVYCIGKLSAPVFGELYAERQGLIFAMDKAKEEAEEANKQRWKTIHQLEQDLAQAKSQKALDQFKFWATTGLVVALVLAIIF